MFTCESTLDRDEQNPWISAMTYASGWLRLSNTPTSPFLVGCRGPPATLLLLQREATRSSTNWSARALGPATTALGVGTITAREAGPCEGVEKPVAGRAEAVPGPAMAAAGVL